jgi:hypothetical protein
MVGVFSGGGNRPGGGGEVHIIKRETKHKTGNLTYIAPLVKVAGKDERVC